MDYYNEGMILWREITTDCKETIVVCNGFGTGDVGTIRIYKRQDTFSTSPSGGCGALEKKYENNKRYGDNETEIKNMSFKVPNQYRIKHGPMRSSDSIGLAGAFCVPFTYENGYKINPDGDNNVWIIAADGEGTGWEHVSCRVITPDGEKTPDWELMCQIKDLFWDSEDCVIQFHPPKSQYVNHHKNVLHLWRKANMNFETPPKELIG